MTETAISPRKLIVEGEERRVHLPADRVKGNEKGDEG